MNSSKRLLFAANDPGGANAIVPVVIEASRSGYECKGFATGPAAEICSRANIPFETRSLDSDLDALIDTFKPDVFLAGRSVADDSIDKRILAKVSTRSIPSVYVLDFWNQYWERFSSRGRKDFLHLPTLICVMDDMAKEGLVRSGVSAGQIRVTGNPYFEHFADGISREHERRNNIVFVSQPLSETGQASEYGFDEYATLKPVIRVVSALEHPYVISIRLHPKEDRDKYDTYLSDNVRIASEKTLEETISHAGLVVGMFSPVLMQAALAGKNVLSYQPNLRGDDPLPTNKFGVTKRAMSDAELKTFLLAYDRGENPGLAQTKKDIFGSGAAEKIIAVLDEAIAAADKPHML